MNAWKPEITIGDIPLIVHALAPAASVCRQIVIVGGYQFEKLEQLVRGSGKLGKADRQKIEIVENKKYTAGMFSSVKVGMVRADQSNDGIFVVPGDMPFIDVETYRTLAASFQTNPDVDVFVPAAFAGTGAREKPGGLKKGHPILIRQRIRVSILQENDDTVLREVLKKKSSKVCNVEDRGIFLDIDNEADLERAYSKYKRALLAPVTQNANIMPRSHKVTKKNNLFY
jgi:molybdenum cofactor cytidylyltransferase